MQAALFAATAGKGPPSAAPMPTDVARAVPQLRRGMNAPSVSIGGQNLRLLETETDRAQATRAARMEDAAVLRQQDRQDKAEDNAARTKREIEVAQARVQNTGLSPTDRAYAATLQFARTPTFIDTFTGERTFPDEQEVAAFAQQAKIASDMVYRNIPPKPQGLIKPTNASQEDWDEYLREKGQTP